MGSKAYQKMGTIQGKENTSLYQYWVDLAEDAETGFSRNFFEYDKRKYVLDEDDVIGELEKSKGAWQDWASRTSMAMEKVDRLQGKDPKGGVILQNLLVTVKDLR